eukprot:GHVU01176385.1.p1 GENE.GHVU01176385.1~~GHVU01176385.1.p1  ORF type:complete len:117 (+),score=11.74 GHVU01176385.1:84-434(+)
MKLPAEEERTAAMVSWLIQGKGQRLITALNRCYSGKDDADQLRHDFVELINQNLKSFTKYADSNCDGAGDFRYTTLQVTRKMFASDNNSLKLTESQKNFKRLGSFRKYMAHIFGIR